MKKFLQKIASIFASIFSKNFWDRLLAGIEAVTPYLEITYDVVKVAAAMTPNRTDDELVALAERFGVPAIWQSQDKGQAIREIVYAALKAKLPDLPDRTIYRAIELAYGAMRP